MKGIILAGGKGTRLFPSTLCISKQLLTIYDKPMIYYPLSVLMLADIREILIISTKRDKPMYEELLGDGSQIGMKFTYAVQNEPRGLAEAFIIGENFIGSDSVCLILGDNLFYGNQLSVLLSDAVNNNKGATIFGYYVSNPSEFGVIEWDREGKILSLVEKPKLPKSNYAVPGIYFYDNDVINIAKKIKPSQRGELEITEVNNFYLAQNRLRAVQLSRGIAWLDTGTHSSLLNAANFVEAVQSRQGLYISCIEEIAFHKKYITAEQLLNLAEKLKSSEYGSYIEKIVKQKQGES